MKRPSGNASQTSMIKFGAGRSSIHRELHLLPVKNKKLNR